MSAVDNKLPISSSQYSLQTNGANGANSINKQEEAVLLIATFRLKITMGRSCPLLTISFEMKIYNLN
jgi:hypothetical protein